MAIKHVLLSAVAVAVLAACNSGTETAQAPAAPAEQAAVPAEKVLSAGIEKNNFDSAVRPQDDLFRHVNGGWLKTVEIPADKSNYGSFTKLADDAQANLKTIIEEADAADAPVGSEKQKVGDFFRSWMDEAKLAELGAKPLDAMLADIDALKDKKEFASYSGKVQRWGQNAPVGMGIQPDAKNPNSNAVYIGQSGLGLPDRDFYLQDDKKPLRDAYVAHITKMFELAGVKDAPNAAKKVFAFEEKLAKVSWPKEDNRNPDKIYNPKSPEELAKLAPDFDWAGWLNALGVGNEKLIIVAQPSYMTEMGKIIKATPLDDLKLHAKFHAIRNMSNALAKPFDDENFAFYGKILNGQQEQQPRWKRGVQLIDGSIGEAVGKIYVEKHFSPDAKTRMDALVQNLLKAYGEGIDSLEWMTPETKKAAREKLAKFTYKIGYPNEWRDYGSLEIKPDDLAGNLLRASEFEYNRNLAKLGKPVDRNEWYMTPQTVNAYYNPLGNEIVFPAAILQPPFFNPDADDAVNYGGIGAVIGHEIGHGFDDQGSKFDGDGALRMWWTEADLKEFEARTAKLAAQYDQFEPLPGQKVNGKFTSGENIGDLGGLTIAYRAYQLSLGGKEAKVIDGMTGDQRFFYGWAQVWARKYRDENLKQRLVTDPHSPSEYRANGVVRNMPEFYKAFDVKEGDKLFLAPEERVKIW